MGEDRTSREVNAVVFTDLVGFTALTEAHGDETALGAVSRARDIVRAASEDHGLRIIKSVGDGFLLLSRDAGAAMAGALDALKGVCREPHLPVMRVGIDAGPVLVTDDDVFGGVVNRAARVCAEAQPDQVLVTKEVLDLADPPTGAQARRLGPRLLRNLTTPVHIFVLAHECDNEFVTDPVCRMSVPREESTLSVTIHHDTFYFCSLDCLRRFSIDVHGLGGAASVDSKEQRENDVPN